jgi:hypothetical protein
MPLQPETRGLVNAEFIQKMKPGAYLINTARGELIDEAALAAAIKDKRVRGAALDVFSQEPPSPDNPLLGLQEVIVTPHCGSHTDGATDAMGWMALRDCLAVLRGELPQYPIIASNKKTVILIFPPNNWLYPGDHLAEQENNNLGITKQPHHPHRNRHMYCKTVPTFYFIAVCGKIIDHEGISLWADEWTL